jgi:glucose-6-phosphate isomerase
VVTFIRVEQFNQNLPFPEYASSPHMSYLAGHTMGELLRVEQQATAAALVKNQRSNCTLSIPEVNATTTGALLYMFEVQTLFAGYLFNVNPLDQPGVEEGKHFTYALMGRQDYAEKAQEYASITANLGSRSLVCR